MRWCHKYLDNRNAIQKPRMWLTFIRPKATFLSPTLKTFWLLNLPLSQPCPFFGLYITPCLSGPCTSFLCPSQWTILYLISLIPSTHFKLLPLSYTHKVYSLWRVYTYNSFIHSLCIYWSPTMCKALLWTLWGHPKWMRQALYSKDLTFKGQDSD